MKQGIRVLGIDDSPFHRGQRKALVVGVVCRKDIVEGVLSTSVSVDGDDSTDRLSEMILNSRFRQQLRAIIMNSIMLAGFNAVDIRSLNSVTGVPVIALTRKMPNTKAAERAVSRIDNAGDKIMRMRAAEPPAKLGRWHVQTAGIDLKTAADIIRVFGNEPVRLAHIISSGIITGESHGKA